MLTIMLPGLIWPNPADLNYLQTNTPNLDRLISKSKITHESYSFSDFIYSNFFKPKELCSSSTLKIQSLANIAAKSLNISHEYKYFLFAEPTHLRVDRDRLLISETELLQLDEVESSSIINNLNKHFAPTIKFYQFTIDLWLIGVNFETNGSQFYPILDIIGENIDDYLPTGNNGIKLTQILNEVQMLLFKLPENIKRQQDGLLSVNSLWFWDKDSSRFDLSLLYKRQIFTNYKLIGHLNLQKIPEDLGALFVTQNLESSLIFIDTLYYPACYRDSYSWISNIEKIDNDLFSLLVCYNGVIQILIPTSIETLKITILNTDKYKIWRKQLTLNKVKPRKHSESLV